VVGVSRGTCLDLHTLVAIRQQEEEEDVKKNGDQPPPHPVTLIRKI